MNFNYHPCIHAASALLLLALANQASGQGNDPNQPQKPRGPAPIVTPAGEKIPTVQPLSPRNTPTVPPGGPLSNPIGGGSSSSISTSSSSIVPSPLPSRPVPGTPEAKAMQQRIDAAGSRIISNTFDPKTQSYTTEMSNSNIYSTKGFPVLPPEPKPELRRQQGGMIAIPAQGGSSISNNNNRGGNIYDSTGSPGLMPNRTYDAPQLKPMDPVQGTNIPQPPAQPTQVGSKFMPPVPPTPGTNIPQPPTQPTQAGGRFVPPLPPTPGTNIPQPPTQPTQVGGRFMPPLPPTPGKSAPMPSSKR